MKIISIFIQKLILDILRGLESFGRNGRAFLLYNKSLLMNGEIDNETYVKKCTESIRTIKDASKCRQYEPHLASHLFSWCLKKGQTI